MSWAISLLVLLKLLNVHGCEECAISNNLWVWNRMITAHSLFMISDSRWQNFMPQLWWFFKLLLPNGSSIMLERSRSPFKSWSQIYIFRNYTSGQQTVHAIFNIILSNRRWLSKWVVSVILWQNSFRLECFVSSSGTDTKFFKLNIADTTLSSTIFENVWLRKSIFIPKKHMPRHIFWISCQI